MALAAAEPSAFARACSIALCVVGLVGLVGCGAGGGAGAEPERTQLGANGVLEFEARAEGELVEGRNEFVVELRHAETQHPIEGATLGAETLMRSMGHEAAASPEVLEAGGGRYQVTDVVFSMPGLWELRLRAEKEELYDEVGLLFEVL